MDQSQLDDLNFTANLRDRFAALAMQAIMQSEHHLEAAEALAAIAKIEMQDAISALAYVQADSMIEIRNKPISETNNEKK